ncbi:hypothetical protein [Micromonospora tulbaghiae]|uniref:hypothetical protein n=1 Tax=Micromonospora tulbaghiae TaxID=479978 RepID=UPI0033C79940
MTVEEQAAPTVLPFEGADEWVSAIARRAQCPADTVRIELARQQIRPPAGWGARHHLHLEGMLFAGVKTPTDSPREPYVFHIKFEGGVAALGTHSENDAGKSSVIRTLRWGLRGRCHLQPDVRKWMRAVLVEFRVDDERLAVAFAVNDGEPWGAVLQLRDEVDYSVLASRIRIPAEALREPAPADGSTPANGVFTVMASYLEELNAIEVARFASSEDFERVMDVIMLDRLGFPRVPTWQRRPGEQQAHEGDGVLGELGWATWSSALSITAPSIPVVLGEEPRAVVRLLQMYLGSPWAITVAAIAARKGQISSQIGVLQRRLDDQRAAHEDDLGDLRRRLREVKSELEALPAPVDLADLDQRVQGAAEAGHQAAAAEARYREESLRYGQVSRLLEAAEADVAAVREAHLTRRFWHALKPSCCPRCDTDVTEERWARERAGQCSLCDNPLQLPPIADASQDAATEIDAAALEKLLSNNEADVDLLDDLTTAQLQVRQLEQHLAVVDAARDEAKQARDEAHQRWRAAQADVGAQPNRSVEQWHTLMMERAAIEARIDERENVRPTANLDRQLSELRNQQRIVLAAETEAKKRHTEDQEDLLQKVSAKLTDLGKELGVRNLERALLRGNGHMRVTKGGETCNFGQLEDGERLRLKIAVMVALMRVSEEAGVARHPGLILIDSLGREELNPRNMVDMLGELVKLTTEVPHLQVVLTSAYGDRLVEGLGHERVLLAPPGKPLW